MTALLLRFAIEYKQRAPSDAAKKLLPIVIADPPIWWGLEKDHGVTRTRAALMLSHSSVQDWITNALAVGANRSA